MKSFLANRRRSVAVLTALALVVLGVGVSQVLAAGTASAPIQSHNDSCGADIGAAPVGSVTFTKLDKTTLRTSLRINRGVPFNLYTITLFDDSCAPLTTLGTFTTGSTGQGNHTFTSSTFGEIGFFINADDGIFDNDSVTVLVDG